MNDRASSIGLTTILAIVAGIAVTSAGSDDVTSMFAWLCYIVSCAVFVRPSETTSEKDVIYSATPSPIILVITIAYRNIALNTGWLTGVEFDLKETESIILLSFVSLSSLFLIWVVSFASLKIQKFVTELTKSTNALNNIDKNLKYVVSIIGTLGMIAAYMVNNS